LGKEDKFRYKGAAMLASMGIAMVLSTFLGLVIGLYLDRVFGTEPWLMIVFLILGIAAGFWNIHVTIKRYGS
jgi:ATP synthase protein I